MHRSYRPILLFAWALVLAAEEAPPALKPVPQISEAEREAFLKTAKIVEKKVMDVGTTASTRAKLSNGAITHDAHIQYVDVFKPVFRGKEGTIEKNFRDTYKFNIAAYRLSKLLGLDSMVPMSVERDVDAKFASVTWWVDNVWMTEAERRDKKIKPPADQGWVDLLNIVRVFDQLIYNTDRNQGNLLISPDWKLYMIDHTRAFRANRTLFKPESLSRCDFKLLQAMKQLNTLTLKQELGAYLRPEEIAGLLARRDLIVQFFEKESKQKGEDSVLTGMPRKTPSVSVP
ncbi:MAG: hypothetical protein WKF37_13310 [Bryobacteraceae bacterium]